MSREKKLSAISYQLEQRPAFAGRFAFLEAYLGNFTELQVWQKAHQLTLAIYRVSSGFPREEIYGLTSQLRRSCASIPANLAEGCGRNRDTEFARFCSIALGSANEVEYHLLLAKDLNLISPKDHTDLKRHTTEVKRMLASLLGKLKADS